MRFSFLLLCSAMTFQTTAKEIFKAQFYNGKKIFVEEYRIYEVTGKENELNLNHIQNNIVKTKKITDGQAKSIMFDAYTIQAKAAASFKKCPLYMKIQIEKKEDIDVCLDAKNKEQMQKAEQFFRSLGQY